MGKKRVILQRSDEEDTPVKSGRPALVSVTEVEWGPECGRLVIRPPNSDKALALVIPLTPKYLPVIVGRHRTASYIIPKESVSNHHFKIYAFTSDAGDSFACLEDVSSHGTKVNGRWLRKRAVILEDGDKVQVEDHEMTYRHGNKRGSSLVVMKDVGDYTFSDRVLGTGGQSSSVMLSKSKSTGQQYACKILSRSRLYLKKESDSSVLAKFKREIDILKDVTHPNVNKIADLQWDQNRVYLFLDLVMGGDLFGYIDSKGVLDVAESKWIGFQILKLENVLLLTPSEFPRVQIADFGSARLATAKLHSVQGTLTYLPPEILTMQDTRELYDGKLVDCWTVGIIIYILLMYPGPSDCVTSEWEAGDNIHFDSRISRPIQHNGSTSRKPPTTFGKDFGEDDSELKAIISGFLKKNPSQRLSAADGLNHPWFRKNLKQLEDLYLTKVIKPHEEHEKAKMNGLREESNLKAVVNHGYAVEDRVSDRRMTL
ncbi:kinase-like protein [Atractiella rhizophila]|nr:kinase-like protein [Atractiella rhizophila]